MTFKAYTTVSHMHRYIHCVCAMLFGVFWCHTHGVVDTSDLLLMAKAAWLHAVLSSTAKAAQGILYSSQTIPAVSTSVSMQVDWTLATDLLIDLFFMSDILLNFNTGYITDQVRPCIFAFVTPNKVHLKPNTSKYLPAHDRSCFCLVSSPVGPSKLEHAVCTA